MLPTTKFSSLALLLLLWAATASCVAAPNRAAGIVPPDTPETRDPAKAGACDCCQKCKAAKSPVQSKSKEGEAVQDGCEDCCNRCGQPLKPAPLGTPPEIMEKTAPPDIKEIPGQKQ
ncbi:hypothetical protein L4X63_12515 [Geomonas sp. Red32]|uniref:hypothetical protein n=1 Tax=Geomonas sp. Red32 TaxID=2912856 RepID=UPI00202D032C|nr:hypothetical protein [Geomonas sp. Red32]MCM0082413.1 hypothetical protein [Geomonas sp. Red32]